MEWKDLQQIFEQHSSFIFNHMNDEFSRIRSGRISLNVLDVVKVHIYGENFGLNQIANLQIVDARQILIKPYDRNQINDIARAITIANINVNPQINTDNIRLVFPTQTEENRINNVKKCKTILEQEKTKLRDVRKIIQNKYKDLKDVSKDKIHYFEEELNKITKLHTSKLEDIFVKKEQELMRM